MQKEAMGSPGGWDLLARSADGLTLGRLFIAIALVPVLGTGHTSIGAGLVGLAWLSDFLDGRAARASSSPTRLGAFDLWVDTLVGAAVLLGFVAVGWVPWIVGLGMVVVLVPAFALTGNEAMSLLLQATAYALLLWRTWRDGPPAMLAWLLGIILILAVVNRRVFWERSVPTFVGGMADLFRSRSSR